MEALANEGLVRNIGVSNVGTSMIRQVLSYATVKPAALQVEMHPYLTQAKLLRMAKENGLAVMAYSNFGPISYIELGGATMAESLMTKPEVEAIATAHNKTPAQVLLRYAVQRGTTAIPKSTKVERLLENAAVFDFNLSEEQVATLDGFNKNQRYNDPGNYAEPAFGCYCPIFD